MATPTISALSPAAGHTGGRQIVEIEGTGFRTPTPQAAVRGITPPPPPSVAVTFGGVPALEVRWITGELLYVVTPITPNPGAGPVDVVVTNIDDTGAPIAGESVTAFAGFAYLLPVLTGDNESDLARVIRAFLQELKRQVTPNVAYPANTDYDDAGNAVISVAHLPTMPGLVITDCVLRENAFYSIRGMQEIQSADGESFAELAPPTTVDIVFTLAVITNSHVELLNLTAAAKRFFKKNPHLALARDPADASKGVVQYELQGYQDPETRLAIESNPSNVRHSVMTATIVGFDIESMAMDPGAGLTPESEGLVDAGLTNDGGVTLIPTGQLDPPV